jgi:hypothetical protein
MFQLCPIAVYFFGTLKEQTGRTYFQLLGEFKDYIQKQPIENPEKFYESDFQKSSVL